MRIRPLDFELEWRRAHPFPWGRNGTINPFVCHFGTSQHSTTETKTNDPWAPQQPYLTAGFAGAQNLLDQPPPQQQNPVAPFNGVQTGALDEIIRRASGGSPVASAATNFSTALQNGNFLNSNPGQGYFSSLAGSNLGLNNPGAAALSGIASGNSPGADILRTLSGSNPGVDNAGTAALTKFANGGYFSNGYSDDAAKSVMAKVVPQIAAQFNAGNAINNPLAARSAAEGATAALAPLEFQNQLQQEQLAQGAASTLANNKIAGSQAQGTFASLLDNLKLSAGSNLNTGAIAGGSLQATGAKGLSDSWQDTLAKMVQGNALAPQNQALNYADLDKMFGAGGAYQTQAQNEAGGQAATYNFSQMSPYQQLQAYMQAVTGSYGGTSSDTKPYYTNDTANTLGTITGAASTVATILPFL